MVDTSKHSSGSDYIKTQDTVLKLGLRRQCILEHSGWEDYIKTLEKVFKLVHSTPGSLP